jgi:hypothetical protein
MDMVERVARAMAPAFADACRYWCEGLLWTACTRKAECACRYHAFEAARAAIEAMRVPTEEMIFAAYKASDDPYERAFPEFEWRAMIDAALTSSEPQAPTSE